MLPDTGAIVNVPSGRSVTVWPFAVTQTCGPAELAPAKVAGGTMQGVADPAVPSAALEMPMEVAKALAVNVVRLAPTVKVEELSFALIAARVVGVKAPSAVVALAGEAASTRKP